MTVTRKVPATQSATTKQPANPLKEIIKHRKKLTKKALTKRDLMPIIATEAHNTRPPRDFAATMHKAAAKNTCLIAESKYFSPSHPATYHNMQPGSNHHMRTIYEQGGAAALSIVTEPLLFGGHIQHLPTVWDNVKLPVLRKDFLLSPYDVYESRCAGADAIQLILGILDYETAHVLELLAHQLDMAVILEVHDRDEFYRAIQMQSEFISVNCRDLKTMAIDEDIFFDLGTTAKTAAEYGKFVIAESGIKSREEIEYLQDLGYKGFLVGEALLNDPDPELKLQELLDKWT